MLELLVRAARKGHRKSRDMLVAFVEGPAAKRNPARARRIAQAVAETGNDDLADDAACELIYGDRVFGWDDPSVPGADRPFGIRLLRQLARRGNVNAMHSLYLAHVRGSGVPRDAREAERWARRALERGDSEPMNNIGVSLFSGDEFPRDVPRAVRCYRAAAAKGDRIALHNLGLCYRWGDGVAKDPKRALRLWRRAAVLGHQGAQMRLAEELLDATIGRKDVARGVGMLRRLSKAGFAPATHELARRLLEGLGVPKNVRSGLVMARRLCATSPELGAELLGGYHHDLGHSDPKHFATAKRWFERAVAKGGEAAHVTLASCLLDGHPPQVRKDLRRGRALLVRAVELGNGDAMAELGSRRLDGDGFRRHRHEGVLMLENACFHGAHHAAAELARRYESGKGLVRDPSQARRWRRIARRWEVEDAE